MKKSIFKLMFMLAAVTLFVGCSSDDDNPPSATCSDGIQNGSETGVDCGGSCTPCMTMSVDLSGDITTDTTLDASVEYNLKGGYIVKSGVTLTIPAGTTIKAAGGTAAFIGVERGAQIFVEGTASDPVVMTSSNDTPAAGDWGGLVIAGDAPTNKGTDVTTEVGDLTYGGSTADDNSGSIRYLRVEYTGATFSNDKEFNGVSLFGVGSGTTFEFVQSFNGGDDGIEFFGGTVNGNNLVSIGSGDDSIDYADGWAGSGSNWYIAGGAKAGIEGSNNGDDGNATPVTTTSLSNITVVGPTNDEGAFFFKEGGGNVTIDNFYISNAAFGITVESSDAPAIARIDGGDLVITNIQFADTPDGFEATTYTGSATFFTEGVATGAGNGAASPDWASGWTTGLSNSTATSENLAGEVTGDVTLNASVEYFLTSGFVVKSGGSLTIPAGTTIKATGGTAAFIGVERGAQIFVEGTASDPVVMTSSNDTPAAGDWGGLVIAGDAPTNKGTDVTTEVGDLTYGGSTADDNSGSIRYLRVEYTGATFSNDKEFNGVSLFGVGSGTTFEFVQSLNGGDDGIEFFGGTVVGNNLVSIGSGDDSIDFADGWAGTGSNWYIKGGAKAGIEGSNNGDDGNATPVTTTTLSNISVVGPTNDEGALFFKEGGGNFTIDNFYVSNANFGITVKSDDAPAIARIDNGDLTITNIQFADNPAGFAATTYTGSTTFFTEGTATGAGNGAAVPDWATNWIRE